MNNIANDHKYAVLFERNKLTFYYDDYPVKIEDINATKFDHVLMIIISIGGPITILTQNYSLPDKFFDIDYLRICRFKAVNDCTGPPLSITNFNKNNYTFNIKSSITINNSSINTTDNVHFWATNYILLDSGTEITSGNSGSFSVNITTCPQN
jgi:hypothetical protein